MFPRESRVLALIRVAAKAFEVHLRPPPQAKRYFHLLIQRTLHPKARLIQDMGIDHRRAYIAVTQQLLHRPDIVPIFE